MKVVKISEELILQSLSTGNEIYCQITKGMEENYKIIESSFSRGVLTLLIDDGSNIITPLIIEAEQLSTTLYAGIND